MLRLKGTVIKMKLAKDFDDYEFTCKCGCGRNKISDELVQKLQKLKDELGAELCIITSGYRCPTHSVRVGGYVDDAHTRGIASDCIFYRDRAKKNPIPVTEVARKAEKLGFTGIGLMDGNAIHLDIRNSTNYKNSKWFGDERTGATIQTFDVLGNEKEPKTVQTIQTLLNKHGYNCGAVDGIVGNKTINAMINALYDMWA